VSRPRALPRWRLVPALALLALAPAALADEPAAPLHVDWVLDGVLTGATLTAWGVSGLLDDQLAPRRCRWCGTPALDARVRGAVAWRHPGVATRASDVLAVALPLGVGAYDLLAARAAGPAGHAGQDLLLIGESVGVASVVSQLARFTTARQRPSAFYGGGTGGRADHLSFWSGHSATVFSAAAAGGTVARLRGYQGWPWVYAAGFTAAAATGYFRMAGDQHWLTDTLVGAAVGTGAGLLVPWLHRSGAGPEDLRVVPVPGGLALAGGF
jgi:membrane-associated phospholipid phosphatase